MKAKFPLMDGQKITTTHGVETVGGEITPAHTEPICWTLAGNWYRRRDGEPMTGAGGEVMTATQFYRLRQAGKAAL